MLDRLPPLDTSARIAAALLMLLASFTLGRCDGARREAARQEVLRADAVARAIEINAGALDAAASARAADAAAVGKHEKGLNDAVTSTPDGRPDAVRIGLGCERLRAQGSRDADLPSACRPARGAEATGRR